MKRNESKRIEISVVDNHSRLQSCEIEITFQSHIGDDFGPSGNTFVASDGFILQSCACPAISGDSRLYVRGFDTSMHNSKFFVKKVYFSRLMKAIQEYNDYFRAIPAIKFDTDDTLFKL